MSVGDDHEVTLARAEALEAELAQIQAKVAAKQEERARLAAEVARVKAARDPVRDAPPGRLRSTISLLAVLTVVVIVLAILAAILRAIGRALS